MEMQAGARAFPAPDVLPAGCESAEANSERIATPEYDVSAWCEQQAALAARQQRLLEEWQMARDSEARRRFLQRPQPRRCIMRHETPWFWPWQDSLAATLVFSVRLQCAQPSWDETTFNQLCEQEEREQATPCGTCTPSSRLSALQQQQQPWHVPWWMYHDRHPMTVRVKLEDVCFDKSNDDSEDDRDNWKRLLSKDAEFQQQQQGLLESVLTRGVHNRYWHFALVRDEVGFTVVAGVQHAQLRVPAWLARGTGSNEALAATSDVSSALSASEASQRLVAYWRAKPMMTTRFINGKYKLLSSTTGLWSFKPPSYTAERHIIGDLAARRSASLAACFHDSARR